MTTNWIQDKHHVTPPTPFNSDFQNQKIMFVVVYSFIRWFASMIGAVLLRRSGRGHHEQPATPSFNGWDP